jgi:hypothetical protein
MTLRLDWIDGIISIKLSGSLIVLLPGWLRYGSQGVGFATKYFGLGVGGLFWMATVSSAI